MSSRWLDSALPPLGARPRSSQRLIAVPYRHAGLIALCALAGAIAASAPSLLHARTLSASGHAAQPWPDTAATMGLRLDLEPGFDIAGDAAAPATDGLELADAQPGQPSALQLDDARRLDEIELALREAPPAAGLVAAQSLARPATADGDRWRLGGSGIGIGGGLLLGLLAAAIRELRGQRMRSSREAEWALGAPVLAAIPTLSTRARAALLAPPRRA
jgi:hypothetical protein